MTLTSHQDMWDEASTSEPVDDQWLEGLLTHHSEGHPIGDPAAKDLLREVLRLRSYVHGLCAPTHRHKKMGTLYRIVGNPTLQLSPGYSLQEGDELIVYVGQDGKSWARSEGEFDDGRFEELSSYRSKYLPTTEEKRPESSVTRVSPRVIEVAASCAGLEIKKVDDRSTNRGMTATVALSLAISALTADFSASEKRIMAVIDEQRPLDIYRLAASRRLRVPYDEVTDDQRRWAKNVLYVDPSWKGGEGDAG